MKLTVASPCSESWDAMPGDDRKRFCDRCQLNVFNLSAMSEEEAERFLNRPEGPPCVRFYLRRDGTVLMKDCPVGWRRKIAKRLAVAATILFGVIFALSTFGSDSTSVEHPSWVQVFLDWLNPPTAPAPDPLAPGPGRTLLMGKMMATPPPPPGP